MKSLRKISRALSDRVDELKFGAPITHVYNPLDYARAPHEKYLERYGQGPKEILLLGMNPGPFGMAQTGVPFGDVPMVREWLGITGVVGKPEPEHPARPIQGFDCTRSEVSGSRLWGWAKARFATPEKFFERFFVVNYCPLVFMESGGKNFTPDKLPAREREPLLAACDEALVAIVRSLQPKLVIGVGAFAERCAERALGDLDVRVGTILHPSPASPIANRGWASHAEGQLRALGVAL
ncbi:MAG TPA: uracil-DNA glycosylase family protein [Polyangiaceae bacterium]|nr:uracil-DNA glycosylase family protein [Polyangiaceae bacterium]